MYGRFTPEEIAYMDYLDEIFPDCPSGGLGLLLRKGDPIAFSLGLSEWVDTMTDEERDALGLPKS